MKRFLLFEFDDYYPQGGMEDFTGEYDTQEEALRSRAEKKRGDNFHIYDTVERRFVEDNRFGSH